MGCQSSFITSERIPSDGMPVFRNALKLLEMVIQFPVSEASKKPAVLSGKGRSVLFDIRDSCSDLFLPKTMAVSVNFCLLQPVMRVAVQKHITMYFVFIIFTSQRLS